jgi:hypothetical protein
MSGADNSFAARVAERARQLAEAHLLSRRLKRDPARWRRASLLWPTFNGER